MSELLVAANGQVECIIIMISMMYTSWQQSRKSKYTGRGSQPPGAGGPFALWPGQGRWPCTRIRDDTGINCGCCSGRMTANQPAEMCITEQNEQRALNPALLPLLRGYGLTCVVNEPTSLSEITAELLATVLKGWRGRDYPK